MTEQEFIEKLARVPGMSGHAVKKLYKLMLSMASNPATRKATAMEGLRELAPYGLHSKTLQGVLDEGTKAVGKVIKKSSYEQGVLDKLAALGVRTPEGKVAPVGTAAATDVINKRNKSQATTMPKTQPTPPAQPMVRQASDAYAVGFDEKCAEFGIDAEELLSKLSASCSGSHSKKKSKKKMKKKAQQQAKANPYAKGKVTFKTRSGGSVKMPYNKSTMNFVNSDVKRKKQDAVISRKNVKI